MKEACTRKFFRDSAILCRLAISCGFQGFPLSHYHLAFPLFANAKYKKQTGSKSGSKLTKIQSAEDGRIAEELPGARLFQSSGAGCRQLKSAPGVYYKLSHPGCKISCRSISGCIIMSKNLTRNNLPTKLGCTLHIQIVTVIYLEVLFTRYRLHVTRYKQFLFFQLRFECCLIFLKKQPRFLLACCYPEPTAE